MSEQLTLLPGFAAPARWSSNSWVGSSKSDEWYTPPRIVEAVIAALGAVDLDPCSDPGHNVPAARHFTLEHDGMAQEWGGRVFMNPPYSGRQIGRWVRKLAAEIRAGRVTEAVTLTPGRTDARWFQLLWRVDAMCFVLGRVNFLRPEGPGSGSTFATVLAYFGPNRVRFAAAFEGLGKIIYL